MWHWPIGKDLDLSFIWGHHHLSEYMDISRPADYFIACYTVLTRPNKVETAVHGCSSWLSAWPLSRHVPKRLATLSSNTIHSLTRRVVDRNIAISPLHYPVTWYGINYAGTQVTLWDFQNKGTRTISARLSYAFKVPLGNLRLSIVDFVPCDRIIQRAFSIDP